MSRLRSNDPCWCGSARKWKRCHGDFVTGPPVRPGRVAPPRSVPSGIERPWYVRDGDARADRGPVQIFDDVDDLARLRHAGRVAAEVLDHVGRHVAVGVTTDELDEIAHEAYVARSAYPSTLHYQGFAKSICTSVNEVVCHGIGDDRPLVAGDIVNVDVTAFVDGMHGDTSATFLVGEVTEPVAALVSSTADALERAIGAIRAGAELSVVAGAIAPFAHGRGYGIVADFGGHGIGRHFHARPHVDHHAAGTRTELCEGMVFTIEPMLTAGTPRHHTWPDRWTVVTDDLLPSAQFEHTVLVTATGAEVLTAHTVRAASEGGEGPTARRVP